MKNQRIRSKKENQRIFTLHHSQVNM